MKLLIIILSIFLASCASFVPKNYKDYALTESKPTTKINFLPGKRYGPYTNLYFFDDAKKCTNRYVLGLVDPNFDYRPITFYKNKRFAFSYRFQEINLLTIYTCIGTYEFTPKGDEYNVTISRNDDTCYINVVEVGAEDKRIELIERESKVPFSEDGEWCS